MPSCDTLLFLMTEGCLDDIEFPSVGHPLVQATLLLQSRLETRASWLKNSKRGLGISCLWKQQDLLKIPAVHVWSESLTVKFSL